MLRREELLGADEVAALLGLTRAHLLRKIRQGDISCYRFSRSIFRFTPEQVAAYQAKSEIVAGPSPSAAPMAPKLDPRTLRALRQRQDRSARP